MWLSTNRYIVVDSCTISKESGASTFDNRKTTFAAHKECIPLCAPVAVCIRATMKSAEGAQAAFMVHRDMRGV